MEGSARNSWVIGITSALIGTIRAHMIILYISSFPFTFSLENPNTAMEANSTVAAVETVEITKLARKL